VAGRPAKPALKPPFPSERGLDNRPTLVQNAETLAQLALIARYGPHWFREAGTVDAPGTALVTLSGAIARPGVHELELGTTVGELLRRAGGVTEPMSAVLVGGYFGGWIAATDVESHRLLPETLGAGAIVVFPASACAVAECARVLRYLAGESAGQCGPCVHGLAAIADGFGRLALGKNGSPNTLARWADMVAGRGACRHPDGAARFLTSSLLVFADELARHARNGVCGRAQRPILPVARA
jgi:NADH:ubiquinone oxidoreductase subunit F (NADH-binding)